MAFGKRISPVKNHAPIHTNTENMPSPYLQTIQGFEISSFEKTPHLLSRDLWHDSAAAGPPVALPAAAPGPGTVAPRYDFPSSRSIPPVNIVAPNRRSRTSRRPLPTLDASPRCRQRTACAPHRCRRAGRPRCAPRRRPARPRRGLMRAIPPTVLSAEPHRRRSGRHRSDRAIYSHIAMPGVSTSPRTRGEVGALRRAG